MNDEASATSMVNYYANSGAPFVRGRNVYVQFSNHKELKTENSHTSGVSKTGYFKPSYLFVIFFIEAYRNL